MIHKVMKDYKKDISIFSNEKIYDSIQLAIDHANPGDTIEIKNGRYEEKVRIIKKGLSLIGESKDECVITYGDYALKQHDDGNNYGTFRTYTCLVLAEDVTLSNLTVENSAGDGRSVGQAIALYVEGERFRALNCNLVGYQDTLFAGPLPPKPIIPGSFVGPTEGREYTRSLQYYDHCYIIGDVDFIFGSALAVFNHCSLVTRNRDSDVNGYVTAPSTWEGEPYGFVFVNCSFAGEEGINPGTVFFGRPWRPYGQVMLIGCSYDESIHADHFDPWGKEENKKTARFSEYGCWLESKISEPKDNKLTEDTLTCLKDKDPFIIVSPKVQDVDFMESWHREMLFNQAKSINNN